MFSLFLFFERRPEIKVGFLEGKGPEPQRGVFGVLGCFRLGFMVWVSGPKRCKLKTWKKKNEKEKEKE